MRQLKALEKLPRKSATLAVVSQATLVEVKLTNQHQRSVRINNSTFFHIYSNKLILAKEKEPAKLTKTPASDLSTPPLPKVTAPTSSTKNAAKVEPQSVATKSASVAPATPLKLPKNISELESEVEKHAQIAVDEYNKAIRVLKRLVSI